MAEYVSSIGRAGVRYGDSVKATDDNRSILVFDGSMGTQVKLMPDSLATFSAQASSSRLELG